MFDRIKDIFKRNKNPTLSINPIRNLFNTSFSFGGYKDQLLEVNSLIYTVVDRKSKAIAQLPLKLYKDDTIKDNHCVIKKKTVINNDLAYILNNAPNINMTPYIFWRTMIANKEIYGNAYAYVKRSSSDEIKELLILDPSRVSIYKDSSSGEVYYKVQSNGEKYLHNLDVIHISSVYLSGYKGISFVSCLREQLRLKSNVTKISTDQIDKSIKAGAVLQLPSNLSNEKRLAYKEQFENSYSGGFNGLIVLDAGMSFDQMKYDINDLKQEEINKITAKEVSSVSGLPLFMLGQSDAKYVNMEHQTIDFIQNCIAPEVTLIEQELNRKLLTDNEIRDGYYFKFNINALMRSDMTTRAQYYREMVSMGAMTLNEIRGLEDLESYGEIGERPVISLNYSYLDTLDKHERINNGG